MGCNLVSKGLVYVMHCKTSKPSVATLCSATVQRSLHASCTPSCCAAVDTLALTQEQILHVVSLLCAMRVCPAAFLLCKELPRHHVRSRQGYADRHGLCVHASCL